MTTYRFFGHIIDQDSRHPLPNMRVEAWDAEAKCADPVAFATTDTQGAFTMALDDAYLNGLFQDRTPSIAFRVFSTKEGVQRYTTRTFVWKLVKPSTKARIEVSQSRASGRDAPAPSVVRGVVRDASGAPVLGVMVHAYDVTLADLQAGRPGTLLGSMTQDTTESGAYHITYGPIFTRTALSVVVRAVDAASAVVAESSPLHQAPATATVNLFTSTEIRGRSEFELIHERTTPHVAGFSFIAATADHLDHLSRASDSDPAHIEALASAHKVAQETGLSVQIHYALAREGLPETERALMRLPQREIRRALQSALDRNTVSLSSLGADLDAVMTVVRAAAVAAAFKTPPGGTGNLGGLIQSTLSGDQAKAQSFLDAYFAHEGPIEDFWGNQSLTGSEKQALQFALQVDGITRSHHPLTTALQTRRNNGQVTSLRDLARYDRNDWIALLDGIDDSISVPAGVPGDTLEERKANYAGVLRRTMEEAFPTAAISRARRPSAVEIAAGRLGLSPNERAVIAGGAILGTTPTMSPRICPWAMTIHGSARLASRSSGRDFQRHPLCDFCG